MSGGAKNVQTKAKARPADSRKDDAASNAKAAESPVDDIDASDEDTIVVTCKVGSFQIDPSGYKFLPSGTQILVEGLTLEFGYDRVLVVDEKLAAKIDKVIDGKYDNGSIDPKVLAQLARADGLQVVRPGLERPLFPAWDTLNDHLVVERGVELGYLRNEDEVRSAIRYERQTPKRSKGKREARDRVLHDLRDQLNKVTGAIDTSGTELEAL